MHPHIRLRLLLIHAPDPSPLPKRTVLTPPGPRPACAERAASPRLARSRAAGPARLPARPTMVSALLNDALADPRAVIRSLHAEHAPAAAPPLATRVAQHFRAVLGGDDALSQVCPLPAVDPSRAASPRLVRFRAMHVPSRSPRPAAPRADCPQGPGHVRVSRDVSRRAPRRLPRGLGLR